jgi:hypothetical protein
MLKFEIKKFSLKFYGCSPLERSIHKIGAKKKKKKENKRKKLSFDPWP